MPATSPTHALQDRLFHETVLARARVYAVRPPTPLDAIDLGDNLKIWVKREDLGPMHAYKWRGAYNRMATLTVEERARGVVCASAGNHAQGVAIAAQKLGCRATIYMPLPTPQMKRSAVAEHGGDAVEIILVGDTFDEASAAAQKACLEKGATFVHPYDDLYTMAGQGTLADEIIMSGQGPFDVAYLPIGGGGMCAAVACYLKRFWPNIHIVGVEGEGQASMKAAVAAGEPVALKTLDIFCDGTAVRKAGAQTFPLCRDLVDEFITVSNAQVCSAIRLFWDKRRAIVETAGALGLAGLLSQREQLKGKKALTITSGANLDFAHLAVIAAEAGANGKVRRHIRFTVPERSGGLLGLVETALGDVDIMDFQYGKTHDRTAHPVLGFDASDAEFAALHQRLNQAGIPHQDISGHEDVDFRILRYDPATFRNPLFIRLGFPERAGALRDFLTLIRGTANICYFNYLHTGERVGRALLGFEFEKPKGKAQFLALLQHSDRFRDAYSPVEAGVLARILAG